MRERAGSKLQRASRRQLGPLFSESKHTLSLLPTRKATPRLFSKHDVAHAHQQTDEQTPPREQNTRREVTNRNDATVIDEQTSCVQEQIAEPQTVDRNDKVCKRPKKRSLHAEVPGQPVKPNSDSPHVMQLDPESTAEEPESVAVQPTN